MDRSLKIPSSLIRQKYREVVEYETKGIGWNYNNREPVPNSKFKWEFNH